MGNNETLKEQQVTEKERLSRQETATTVANSRQCETASPCPQLLDEPQQQRQQANEPRHETISTIARGSTADTALNNTVSQTASTNQASSLQSRCNDTALKEARKDLLSKIGANVLLRIKKSERLDLGARPRVEHVGDGFIEVNGRKQTNQMEKLMIVSLSNAWGCDNPSLTLKEKSRVAHAASKQIAYNCGLPQAPGSYSVRRWAEKSSTGAQGGVVDPVNDSLSPTTFIDGASSQQSTCQKTVLEELRKDLLSKIGHNSLQRIKGAERLDLEARPRRQRYGDCVIEVHSRKHTNQMEKLMILSISKSWGYDHPSLTKQQRSRIGHAACKQIAYDAGLAHTSGDSALGSWAEQFSASVQGGRAGPASNHGFSPITSAKNASSQQSRYESAGLYETKVETMLSKIGCSSFHNIKAAERLDLEARPREKRDGDGVIEVHNRMPTKFMEKLMVLSLSKDWGYAKPSLTFKEKTRIRCAACKHIAYDYGLPQPCEVVF